MITECPVLPPPGGSGGFLIPGVRGFPTRACVGWRGFWRAFGGVYAANPAHVRTLWRRYPAQLRTLPSRNPAQARTLSFRNPAHARTLVGARWCTGDTRLRRDRGRRLRSHGGEERWLAGYRRSPPQAPNRRGALPASRRDYSPAVHATAPATVIDELDLAAVEQSTPRAAIGAVCQTGGPAEVVGREIVDHARLVGERGHCREQQPRGPTDRAAAEHLLQ